MVLYSIFCILYTEFCNLCILAGPKFPADLVELEIDSAHGGVIKLDDITLTIGAECLAQDTKITIKYCQNFSFKSLLDLGLVDAAPRVYEFSPNALKFVKPADLTFKVGNDTSGCEPFILHGFHNPENQRIVWELVTDGVDRDAGARKGPGGQTLLKGTNKILITLESIPWNLEG